MDLITKISVYLMPVLLVCTSIAIGIIFKNNRSIGNALLLVGFVTHAFLFIFPLLSNITPIELNEAGQAMKREEGFLSFYQMLLIEVVAYFSITIGFVFNAYATYKNS